MRGRPPSAEELMDLHLSVPARLVREVDLILYDPIRQRPIYGARGELITTLLRQWLAAQKEKTCQTTTKQQSQ